MQGFVALFVLSVWLLWLFYREGKERASVSASIWIAVAWVVIHGTRPVTTWLAEVDPDIIRAGSRDEGNLVEALVSGFLIMAGLIVLLRRGIRWPSVIRGNAWLFVFYLFWLVSIFWSDYPLITSKRLFKELGTVVMVLVVLTELYPGEAVRAVCVRCAYVCIPLSVLLYRYYPALGRAYIGYKGDVQMFVGVATNKNTLGILAAVSALFLLWDLFEFRGKYRSLAGKFAFASRVLVLLMCWYLLLTINSVTSLICAVLGSALLIVLSLPAIRRRPGPLEVFGLGAAVALLVLDSAFNITEAFLQSLGRNMNLTSRTDIWAILIDHNDNPLAGAGFDTFWAGERFELLSEILGAGLIQAHNGYLETYLNGGFIGAGLLVVVLLSAYWRLRKQIMTGMPESGIRYVVLLVAIIYNYSEASFNKVGSILWLLTVYAIMEYRGQPRHHSASVGEGIAGVIPNGMASPRSPEPFRPSS